MTSILRLSPTATATSSLRLCVCRAHKQRPRVKICGLTHEADARCALESGADLLGMILWPHAKRSVSHTMAHQISALTRSYRKIPNGFPMTVGVFVDETAEEIQTIQQKTQIDLVQLHGDGARQALSALDPQIPTIYVLHVNPEGLIQGAEEGPAAPVEYVLLDGMRGGSGTRFPLKELQLPDWIYDEARVRQGWLLAGGLTPNNVADALEELKKRDLIPSGVDVSSGVCDAGGLRKNPTKIADFMRGVQS